MFSVSDSFELLWTSLRPKKVEILLSGKLASTVRLQWTYLGERPVSPWKECFLKYLLIFFIIKCNSEKRRCESSPHLFFHFCIAFFILTYSDSCDLHPVYSYIKALLIYQKKIVTSIMPFCKNKYWFFTRNDGKHVLPLN